MLLRGLRRSKKDGSALLAAVDCPFAAVSWCIGQPAGGLDAAATGGCRSGIDAPVLFAVEAALPMLAVCVV